MNIDKLRDDLFHKQSISIENIKRLYHEAHDSDLQILAQQVRDRFHEPRTASYLVMAIINYTNICIAACDYCSFFRNKKDPESYLLSFNELCKRIDKAKEKNCSLISFNGGFHPGLKIRDYAKLFTKIQKTYPELTFYMMTVAEFAFACKVSKLSFEQGAKILKEAGIQWITGGGSEILSDDFRKRHSPGKGTVEEYFAAQKAIIRGKIATTATMVIGFDESLEERLDHLQRLRQFQEENAGAIRSFLCWTYKPWNNRLGGKETTQQDYLRWLALCRIYLDNIRHIRTSVLTQNENGLLGLLYGADDFDLPTEDEVTEKAGAYIEEDRTKIFQELKNLKITAKHRDPFSMNSFSQSKQHA